MKDMTTGDTLSPAAPPGTPAATGTQTPLDATRAQGGR